MINSNDNDDSQARYYASRHEQQILIQGLKLYFSYPERSSDRNQLCADITKHLQSISKHWDHRKVRLWFNNNKKTYFTDVARPGRILGSHLPLNYHTLTLKDREFGFQQPRQLIGGIVQQNQHIIGVTTPVPMMVSQQLPLQQQINTIDIGGATMNSSAGALSMTNSIGIIGNQNLQQNPQHVVQDQGLMYQKEKTDSRFTNQSVIPNSLNVSPQVHHETNVIPTNPVVKNPQAQKKRIQLSPISLNSGSNANSDENKTPKKVEFNHLQEQSSIGKSSTENIVSQMKELHERLNKYDCIDAADINKKWYNCSQQLLDREKYINHASCNIFKKYVTFPKNDTLEESILFRDQSSEFSLIKTISFPDQDFYKQNYDKQTGAQGQSVWKDRSPSENTFIEAYDCISISKYIAAYAYHDYSTSKRVVKILDVEHRNGWRAHSLDLRTVQTLVAKSPDEFWCYSGNTLYEHNNSGVHSYEFVDCSGDPKLNLLANNMPLLSFSQSSSLYINNEQINIQDTNCKYTCVSPFANDILTAPDDSFGIKLLAADGREKSLFVGHCNIIRGFCSLSDNIFASFADDKSVLIWDVRSHAHLIAVSEVATAICGYESCMFIGTSSKGISVLDLRNEIGQYVGTPLLCVSTQDYYVEAMTYLPHSDTLAMFGSFEGGNESSTIFTDNDGNSTKRIFRVYRDFSPSD